MNYIKLFTKGECKVPRGNNYLMVISLDIDPTGDWLPNKTESFLTMEELKTALFKILASGEQIAIRGSTHFDKLANELGLTPHITEWVTP